MSASIGKHGLTERILIDRINKHTLTVRLYNVGFQPVTRDILVDCFRRIDHYVDMLLRYNVIGIPSIRANFSFGNKDSCVKRMTDACCFPPDLVQIMLAYHNVGTPYYDPMDIYMFLL